MHCASCSYNYNPNMCISQCLEGWWSMFGVRWMVGPCEKRCAQLCITFVFIHDLLSRCFDLQLINHSGTMRAASGDLPGRRFCFNKQISCSRDRVCWSARIRSRPPATPYVSHSCISAFPARVSPSINFTTSEYCTISTTSSSNL